MRDKNCFSKRIIKVCIYVMGYFSTRVAQKHLIQSYQNLAGQIYDFTIPNDVRQTFKTIGVIKVTRAACVWDLQCEIACARDIYVHICENKHLNCC